MDQALGIEHLDEPIFAYLRRDFVSLNASLTVGEALEHLRRRPLGEKIVYFYVVDDDERLKGILPTRRLLMSQPGTALADIMVTNVVTMPSWATVRDASDLFVRHKFLAFPVTDTEGRLHGVADIGLFTKEIANFADRQTADDAFQLIGIHLRKNVGPLGGFRDRFPWLLANVAGGLMAAFVTSWYEGLLGAVVVLALFIPVVLALAESVSIQSVTLTLQTLHGRSAALPAASAVAREFATAALLGAGIAGLWQGNLTLFVTILTAITLSMVTASLLGLLLPTLMRALRRDPNIASGPIVLALADLATLMFYFNLAGWMLR